MKHIRALSFLLLLAALTGYLLEPSIDWDGIRVNPLIDCEGIRVDPRTTYIILLSFLAVFGMVGMMWRKR